MTMKRWCIFIDIEGFKNIFACNDKFALYLLGKMLHLIYKVGSVVYPNEPERLFVHQFSDGFAIISSLPENNLKRPINIAVFLMQQFLLAGGAAKVGISDGDFYDIQGCYPKEIYDKINEGTLEIGDGIIRVSTCLGEALINAYKILTLSPSGPGLFIDRSLYNFIPSETLFINENKNSMGINWIEYQNEDIRIIARLVKIKIPSIIELTSQLDDYLKKWDLSNTDWGRNALKYIKL